MRKKRRYYRTAALLGPQEQYAAYRVQVVRPVKIPWKLIIPLVAMIGLGLWVAFGEPWYLMGEDLQVVGLSSRQLEREVMVVSDLLGWHFVRLQPQQAEERLLAEMPQFSDVKVRCGFIPTSCKIVVTERVPVLVWIEGSDVYWVDREGVIFAAQGERPDLPVVRGTLPGAENRHSVTAILQGTISLASLGLPVNNLECSAQRGLIWTDPEGRRVAFGVGPDMTARWQTYQTLIHDLTAKGIFPQTVDVRFAGGATYSLERRW